MVPGTPVSVLVASYKRPEMLRIALRSVLRQTHPNFDVLVYNDGGIDMRGLVPELEDERVAYHQHPENLGLAQAVAAGLRSLSGEYVAEIDDDDEWDPDFLATLSQALDAHPSAALAFCDHWVMSEDGVNDESTTDATSRQWGRAGLRRGIQPAPERLVFDGCIPTASSALIRRTAIDLGDWPPELSYAADLWLAYLSAKDGQEIVYEPRRLARKRRHAGQMGGALAATNNLVDLTVIYGRMRTSLAFASIRGPVTARLTDIWANLAVAHLRAGEPGEARVAARRGLGLRRTPRACVAGLLACLPAPVSLPTARTISDLTARRRRRVRGEELGSRVA